MDPLQDLFIRALGAEAVLDDPSALPKYEQGWRYGQGQARLVLRPATTAAVSQALALCHGQGLTVLPQGANTGLVGASVPDSGGGMVVLSLERLNRRLDIDPHNRTARVDGGILLSQLNAALEPHGLCFPVDLGADPQIGGMVATNTGGTRLLKYGDVRHNLLGLEVVLADGTVINDLKALRKDNTGLDLSQLFTATSGAWGVVTGAVLNVVPRPNQVAVAWIGCADGEAVVRLLQALEHTAFEALSAFEVISAEAMAAVFRHQPRLRNPFPQLPPYAVLVELNSTLSPEHLNLEDLLLACLGKHVEDPTGEGILDIFPSPTEAAWSVRHQVSESLRNEGKVLGLDLSVPRAQLPAFSQAVRTWVGQHFPFMRVCDFGHWGDGGTHLNLVWNEAEATRPTADCIHAVQEEVYELAVRGYQGSYSAEHGVGPHNQRFYDLYTPEAVKAACAVLKAHFDPKGMLGRVRLH